MNSRILRSALSLFGPIGLTVATSTSSAPGHGALCEHGLQAYVYPKIVLGLHCADRIKKRSAQIISVDADCEWPRDRVLDSSPTAYENRACHPWYSVSLAGTAPSTRPTPAST